jgi:hypothetical protein
MTMKAKTEIHPAVSKPIDEPEMVPAHRILDTGKIPVSMRRLAMGKTPNASAATRSDVVPSIGTR